MADESLEEPDQVGEGGRPPQDTLAAVVKRVPETGDVVPGHDGHDNAPGEVNEG